MGPPLRPGLSVSSRFSLHTSSGSLQPASSADSAGLGPCLAQHGVSPALPGVLAPSPFPGEDWLAVRECDGVQVLQMRAPGHPAAGVVG